MGKLCRAAPCAALVALLLFASSPIGSTASPVGVGATAGAHGLPRAMLLTVSQQLTDLVLRQSLNTADILAEQDAWQDLHNTYWLHGAGSQLFTAWGAPITLRALNWYGFEHAPFVANGLNHAPLDDILRTVQRLGFNALRVLFSDQMVEDNPVVHKGLDANAWLAGKHALDILGIILTHAHRFGLRVILCNSRSEAGYGPEFRTGLWYTQKYPEWRWVADWEELARRFRHQSAFVGADLRNEPHLKGNVFSPQSYFESGPLWGAFHGTYYHDRDWHFAAQTLGNDLLAINPNLLIIVEGVQAYLDPDTNQFSVAWWGSNLTGVQYDTVVLNRPSQLVYSVHDYGPRLYPAAWFTPTTTYASLAQMWTQFWGYLLTAPTFMRAPLFLGEFGTCDDKPYCIEPRPKDPTHQGLWFSSLVRYLHAHPQISWAYWALNPRGPFHPKENNFYSLMTFDWRHVHPIIVRGLAPLLPPRAQKLMHTSLAARPATKHETTGRQ